MLTFTEVNVVQMENYLSRIYIWNNIKLYKVFTENIENFTRNTILLHTNTVICLEFHQNYVTYIFTQL